MLGSQCSLIIRYSSLEFQKVKVELFALKISKTQLTSHSTTFCKNEANLSAAELTHFLEDSRSPFSFECSVISASLIVSDLSFITFLPFLSHQSVGLRIKYNLLKKYIVFNLRIHESIDRFGPISSSSFLTIL